jgi:hypothetical protein
LESPCWIASITRVTSLTCEEYPRNRANYQQGLIV